MSNQSSIAPPSARIKTFPRRWVDFWKQFVRVAESNNALYDDHLFENVVVAWLQHISAAKLRVWREMGTMASFALVSALNDCSVALIERSDVIEQQLADKKIGKSAAALTKEQTTISDHLDVITRINEALFTGSASSAMPAQPHTTQHFADCIIHKTFAAAHNRSVVLALHLFQCIRASLP